MVRVLGFSQIKAIVKRRNKKSTSQTATTTNPWIALHLISKENAYAIREYILIDNRYQL
jgi:hypothetical protein